MKREFLNNMTQNYRTNPNVWPVMFKTVCDDKHQPFEGKSYQGAACSGTAELRRMRNKNLFFIWETKTKEPVYWWNYENTVCVLSN